jgi:hypothetical protein
MDVDISGGTRYEETDKKDGHLSTYVRWDHAHDTPGDMKPHCRFLCICMYGMTTEQAMITQEGQWISRRLTPEENVRLTHPPI